MAKQLQYRRLFWVALLLGLAFAGLGYRLVDLQVLRHDQLGDKARGNTCRKILLEPRRGNILDIRGNLLATSIFVKTVCADPVLIGNRRAEVARALSPLLQMSEGELNQRLLLRTRQNEDGQTITNRYVVLQRKVPADKWERIQQTMTNLSFGLDEKKLPRAEQAFYRDLRARAIFSDSYNDPMRVYPNQTLAAHVLGFIGPNEYEVNNNRVSEITGKEGVEYTFDSRLSGAIGWRVTETDRARREVVTLREQDVEPHDGLDVVLTIDSVVQHVAETALAEVMEKHSPVSASAVVVRPCTGEILAMATLPNFDPNNPGAAPADARRNRIISDVAEPGSTFKMVVVAGALNDRTVTLADQFDCENGHFLFAGRMLRDHEPYGVLSVKNIITKSSNIGAAKIGIRLGESRLHQYIRDFGFGQRTGIPLLGEVGGIVHPLKDWNKLSISRVPMGHEVAATPLQMVMAMCAIANHGRLMRPMVVDRLQDQDGNVVAQYHPQAVRQVIGEAAAHQMVEALKTVVSPEGTAAAAALAQYTVAGKTGTAQKAQNGGYVPGKYFSSFIGFFPADNPELCIVVFLDEPKQGYYGGQVAAPVFKQIAGSAANYLNLRPDKPDAAAPSVFAGNNSNRPLKTASAQLPNNSKSP